jgi:hypothetical protein
LPRSASVNMTLRARMLNPNFRHKGGGRVDELTREGTDRGGKQRNGAESNQIDYQTGVNGRQLYRNQEMSP